MALLDQIRFPPPQEIQAFKHNPRKSSCIYKRCCHPNLHFTAPPRCGWILPNEVTGSTGVSVDLQSALLVSNTKR